MKKFFISFHERTGSTMLCHMLNKHPDIKCFFELLATPHERIKNKQAYHPKNALYEILKHYNIPNGKNVGFKFKYPNQHNYYPEVTKYLYSNHDIKVVFLYRKNTIKQYISKINQLKLIEIYQEANIQEERPIPKILFDPQTQAFFYQYITHYMMSTKLIYELLLNRPNVITINYEELCAQTEETILTICNFLEVDFDPKMLENMTTMKISDNNIQNNFVNPLQFMDYVKKIHLEVFLNDDVAIENWPAILCEPVFDLQKKLMDL